jgi:hypothetical protein
MGYRTLCQNKFDYAVKDRRRRGVGDFMSKQILITGGAGFVGSHLADGLLRSGHAVRVLDVLSPQVHGDRLPEYLSAEVELIAADVRNTQRIRDALRNVDVIFHLAAVVGVGQSMYEISRYMSVNTVGTAELLQAMLDTRMVPEKLVVASSMSIYGEGRYICCACQKEHAPPVRSAVQLRAGEWEVRCPECSGLCSFETRPGRSLPDLRPHLRYARDGIALLQHLRNAPGAFQPLYRSGSHLCLSPVERTSPVGLRRRKADARLRQRA